MRRRRKKKDEDAFAADDVAEDETVDEQGEEDSSDVTPAVSAAPKPTQELEDKLKRAMADMANMRRRASEDQRRAVENATGRVAQELLPILDSFDLALQSEGDRDALLEGMRMVYGMFEDLLARHGIEPIEAANASFDPQLHEALAVQERDDVAEGTVVAVHQNGFRIRDRVLRPARVVVSQRPAGSAASERREWRRPARFCRDRQRPRGIEQRRLERGSVARCSVVRCSVARCGVARCRARTMTSSSRATASSASKQPGTSSENDAAGAPRGEN